ncbi:MAG TPA: helix-turn-helix domain-containing protein [Anaerolineales bacterium]|nr:helix-turn-helix domain-containing protein [Anaerolineales bacterium]
MIEKNRIILYQDKLPRLLTASEVASILGLGLSTIYLLIRRNELPCIRFGRAVRVRAEDMEKFIDSNSEGGRQYGVE